MRDFYEFKVDFETRGTTAQMVDEFRKMMRNWWLNHIIKTDKGLGTYIKAVFPFIGKP